MTYDHKNELIKTYIQKIDMIKTYRRLDFLVLQFGNCNNKSFCDS